MGESTVNIYIYLLFIYDPASRRNLAECDYDPGMPKVFGVDLSRLHTSEKTFVSLKKMSSFESGRQSRNLGCNDTKKTGWHSQTCLTSSSLRD
jgi:hypothetical protein